MFSTRVWLPLGFWIISSLGGCTELPPSASSSSAPLFISTLEDTKRLAIFSHELDAMALQCGEGTPCQQAHFGRALVSLFENRDAARAFFRRVIDENPSSPLAASSLLWLRVIGEEEIRTSPDEQQSSLTDLAAQLVRDSLERQLAERTNQGKADAVAKTQDLLVEQSRVVELLQKQVRERDRRIATLRSQLNALKQIDLDNEERKRALKIPATLLPPTDGRRQGDADPNTKTGR